MWAGYEKRIELLKAGKTLVMHHQLYGKYSFKLNPQQNRLFVKAIDEVAAKNESMRIVDQEGCVYQHPHNVSVLGERFVLWGYGEWSVMITPPEHKVVTTYVEGTYEKL